MQKYITVKQMAERLQISDDTAYQLVHSKGFPAVRAGVQFRIGEDDLEAWLKKQRTAS